MPDNRYIHVKQLSGEYLTDLILSRLRAEGINFRVFNPNASTIYPIGTITQSLEVIENQVPIAKQIIEDIEDKHKGPNESLDFHDASHEDILFEKKMRERERDIDNAKPPYLIIFLFLLIMISTLVYTALEIVPVK